MRILLLFLFFIGFSYQLFAQEQSINKIIHSYDQAYGLSEILYNGKVYFEDKDQPFGSPFLNLPAHLKATVVIKGQTFYDQKILYDCCNQYFVLTFQNKYGGENKIIMQNEDIDTISIGQHVFIVNNHHEINNTFIQVVHDGSFSCFFSWKKEKVFKTGGENPGYYFTNEKRTVYCLKDSIIYTIKSRKNFADLFPETVQKTIKRKLKFEKINFRTINAFQLGELLKDVDQPSAN